MVISAADEWKGVISDSESACPSFAAAPPHTLSFNATIKLQAVRLSIERYAHNESATSRTHGYSTSPGTATDWRGFLPHQLLH